MKKWIVVLLAIILVIGAIAGVAGYRLNTQYGWLSAKTVHYDTLATEQTRLRVAVNTLRLANDLSHYFPSNPALPSWLPWDLPTLVPQVVPREVAILGATDFRAGTYDITLFVNEQRGGPALPDYLNTRTRFKKAIPQIAWEDPGFVLQKRGVLTATGTLALPLGLEETIRETWEPGSPLEPLVLAGGHMAEGIVDNREGDLIVLIAALAPVWHTSLEQLQVNPQFQALLALLAGVEDIHAVVDFKDVDSLVIQVRTAAEEGVGKQLEFMLPMIEPMVVTPMERRYGVTIEVDQVWKADEGIYELNATVKGIEEHFKTYFSRVIPSRPAPKS